MSKAKALVVPIFRRYWLWAAAPSSALPAAASAAAAARSALTTPWWQQGPTLEEKFAALGGQLMHKFKQRLGAEWDKLERAKEGSLRNRGYRMAQAVLAREDPAESFLKAVPTGPAELLLIYPTRFQERLVRRRLRAMAAAGHRRHRRRLLWWGLTLVPQLPLMLTPLPNLTVYYTFYRIYSHVRALQGSKALEKGFAALDSMQLSSLRDALLQAQAASGFEYPPDSWPARLIKREDKYLDIFDRLQILQKQRRLEAQLQGEQVPSAEDVLGAENAAAPAVPKASGWDPAAALAAWRQHKTEVDADTGMKLLFYASADLEEIVKPAVRAHAPLEDSAAMAAGEKFGIPNMIEAVARARRRVTGSPWVIQGLGSESSL